MEQENRLVRTFDPKFYESLGSDSRKLVRLHGCVWMFKQNHHIIQTVVSPESDGLSYEIDYIEEMMIYPTKLKDILVYPYFELHNLFRKELRARRYSRKVKAT